MTKVEETQTTLTYRKLSLFLLWWRVTEENQVLTRLNSRGYLTPLSVVGTMGWLVTFKSFGIQLSTQAKYQILKSMQQFRNYRNGT